MDPKLKLITSSDPTMFERRLTDFVDSLARDDVLVDIKFSTSPTANGVEYSALVHYQATEAWRD
ncbi:MAG: hypothetical protein KF813_12260 [Trueperaceae bacterium]|nr:hypothetical protein [Trueperaceae bacterium]